MKPIIVCIAPVKWEGLFARPQHLMRGLANRGWDVVYVDPPVTWLSPMKQPRLWRDVRPGAELASLEPGINLLRLPAMWPFGNMRRAINRFNQRINAQHVRRALVTLRQTRAVVLYSFLPGAVDMLSHLRPKYVIYDCVDDHASFEGLIRPSVVNEMERELAAKSDAVYATARLLWEKMRAIKEEAVLLPNGAEIQLFRHARHAHEHPDLLRIPGPRIGFYGGIGSWIDLEMLRATARALPHASLVLIGPRETSVETLASEPNVYLLDRRPYPELPNFLAGFDVTVAPFRRNALTESVNPIKVYEYLAAGKEVVATDIPETRRLSDVVWLAQDTEEFIEHVRSVLAGGRRASDEVRDRVVFENSWSDRVEQIHGRLAEVFPYAVD